MPPRKSKNKTEEKPHTAQRTFVILSDGTSNEIKNERTNVLRLYQCIDTTDTEVVFYDPGVGTVGAFESWSVNWFYLKIKELVGLAFGFGLDENVLDAYQFLIDNWKPGDKIYLFGFSRGSYTVRVLAALIYTIGILSKEQSNLKRYALSTLKETSITGDFDKLEIYQETLKRKKVEIEFLGIWDTVSSVFLWVNGWFKIKNIGYSRRNASIKKVRHALAIDERRRFYVQYDWLPDQPITTYLPHEKEFKDSKLPQQDLKEVWFAGAHTDSGGGSSDKESKVAKIAYKWMLSEVKKTGLKLNQDMIDYHLGEKPDKDGNYLTKPDPTAKLYKSLRGLWWVLEIFPKWRGLDEYKNKNEFDPWDLRSWFNFYIPLGKPRSMNNRNSKHNAKILVHKSVQERLDKTDYNPPNFPTPDQIEWVDTE